jgi:hypothetical protein
LQLQLCENTRPYASALTHVLAMVADLNELHQLIVMIDMEPCYKCDSMDDGHADIDLPVYHMYSEVQHY